MKLAQSPIWVLPCVYTIPIYGSAWYPWPHRPTVSKCTTIQMRSDGDHDFNSVLAEQAQ